MASSEEARPELIRQPIPLTPLTAISPVDGRYWSQAEILSPFSSEAGMIQARVEIEARYLIALSEARKRDGSSANLVRELLPEEREFLLHVGPNLTDAQIRRIKQIEDTTQHDVKAMEIGLGEVLKGTTLQDVVEANWIHFGLTSEDVNNLATRLMLDRARERVMVPTANAVVDRLVALGEQHKATAMLARTHGQSAEPTTLGKEMMVFATRLQRQVRRLQDVKLTGKLNGAVGNFTDHMVAVPEVDWVEFSDRFVKGLGFEPNMITNQINSPDDIIEMLDAYKGICGAVLDIDIDMWLYIMSGWFIQRVKSGEVGSSVMPQKVNPIKFEGSEGHLKIAMGELANLATILATSRLQRDLSNSTILRRLGEKLADALLGFQNTAQGLDRARPNLDEISRALNTDWSILSAAVQTTLRRDHVTDAYGLVKGLVRGQHITSGEWQEWVSKLPAEIDESTKARFLSLNPETCIGDAVRLTEMAIEEVKRLRDE